MNIVDLFTLQPQEKQKIKRQRGLIRIAKKGMMSLHEYNQMKRQIKRVRKQKQNNQRNNYFNDQNKETSSKSSLSSSSSSQSSKNKKRDIYDILRQKKIKQEFQIQELIKKNKRKLRGSLTNLINQQVIKTISNGGLTQAINFFNNLNKNNLKTTKVLPQSKQNKKDQLKLKKQNKNQKEKQKQKNILRNSLSSSTLLSTFQFADQDDLLLNLNQKNNKNKNPIFSQNHTLNTKQNLQQLQKRISILNLSNNNNNPKRKSNCHNYTNSNQNQLQLQLQNKKQQRRVSKTSNNFRKLKKNNINQKQINQIKDCENISKNSKSKTYHQSIQRFAKGKNTLFLEKCFKIKEKIFQSTMESINANTNTNTNNNSNINSINTKSHYNSFLNENNDQIKMISEQPVTLEKCSPKLKKAPLNYNRFSTLSSQFSINDNHVEKSNFKNQQDSKNTFKELDKDKERENQKSDSINVKIKDSKKIIIVNQSLYKEIIPNQNSLLNKKKGQNKKIESNTINLNENSKFMKSSYNNNQNQNFNTRENIQKTLKRLNFVKSSHNLRKGSNFFNKKKDSKQNIKISQNFNINNSKQNCIFSSHNNSISQIDQNQKNIINQKQQQLNQSLLAISFLPKGLMDRNKLYKKFQLQKRNIFCKSSHSRSFNHKPAFVV